jgi:hypothetical protein
MAALAIEGGIHRYDQPRCRLGRCEQPARDPGMRAEARVAPRNSSASIRSRVAPPKASQREATAGAGVFSTPAHE